MKFIQPVMMICITLFSTSVLAGIYKCTDDRGNTSYQAKPCSGEKKAIEIDVKTGSSTNLSVLKKKKEKELELKKRQEIDRQKLIELEAGRKRDAKEQSSLNQQLVKNNPIQYSAFSIPPYRIDRLSDIVKEYETKLPDIEKLRRFAAKKALASGECMRVEASHLSKKSSDDQLVFSVDCSSANTFYFNEQELLKN
ncbi:MAG: DUF4124 domain-containing protein [Methylococcaceae bacterium]|nr:DUF4124 domain-containing protein [Methylococcaceae bacterium]